jgi:hypothetical protein
VGREALVALAWLLVQIPSLAVAQVHLRGLDGADADSLSARVTHAAEVVDARLGTSGPIEVEVAPDLETFAREGGRGRLAGAVEINGRILMPPPRVLARFEDLDATLRHELVHLRVSEGARHLPLWLHEGLACEVSGEDLPVPGPLPANAEALGRLEKQLHDDRSPQDLGRDYAIARALVRKLGPDVLIREWKRLRQTKDVLGTTLEGRTLAERLWST